MGRISNLWVLLGLALFTVSIYGRFYKSSKRIDIEKLTATVELNDLTSSIWNLRACVNLIVLQINHQVIAKRKKEKKIYKRIRKII